MLKDRESFAILLADKEQDILDIVQKISLRKHIGFNRCKLSNDIKYNYVLYTEPSDKQYLFDMARNKKIKIIWKDNEFFGVIDFKYNTKGDIVCYLLDENLGTEKVEGDVITPNLKSKYRNMKKVQLVSSIQIDDEQPHEYEHFCFYIKN